MSSLSMNTRFQFTTSSLQIGDHCFCYPNMQSTHGPLFNNYTLNLFTEFIYFFAYLSYMFQIIDWILTLNNDTIG